MLLPNYEVGRVLGDNKQRCFFGRVASQNQKPRGLRKLKEQGILFKKKEKALDQMSWTGLGHTAIPSPRITTCIYCPWQLPAGFPLLGCIVEKEPWTKPCDLSKSLTMYCNPDTCWHFTILPAQYTTAISQNHLRSYKRRAHFSEEGSQTWEGWHSQPRTRPYS